MRSYLSSNCKLNYSLKLLQWLSEYPTSEIWTPRAFRMVVWTMFWFLSHCSKTGLEIQAMIWLYANQTHCYHLNTVLVQYSDPHCIKTLSQKFTKLGKYKERLIFLSSLLDNSLMQQWQIQPKIGLPLSIAQVEMPSSNCNISLSFCSLLYSGVLSMSTKDLSYLLDGESSQERGSEWAGGGSDPPNNYQPNFKVKHKV